MKKKIKVIRSANKTIVIYSEPTKAKAAPKELDQKPFLVRMMGRADHFIMPDGRIYPVKYGRFWKFIKLVRPRSQFVTV